MFDRCQTMNASAPSQQDTSERADPAAIDVVTVLQALADPVRIEIVRQLADAGGSGELRCGQIDVPVGKSTASHHLKVLCVAGITSEREEGTRKYIRLRTEELEQRFPGLVEMVRRSGNDVEASARPS
jgi:DNA-binding transcriptional ArsR family regulator